MFSVTSTWHYTGDYGFCQRDGKVVIIDKVKDLIKYRQHFLSPRKIENKLRCHPAISEVIVRSEPNSSDGQFPRAYITIKNGAKVYKSDFLFPVKNKIVYEKFTLLYVLGDRSGTCKTYRKHIARPLSSVRGCSVHH